MQSQVPVCKRGTVLTETNHCSQTHALRTFHLKRDKKDSDQAVIIKSAILVYGFQIPGDDGFGITYGSYDS
jgi:hypothetical protein